ncbi:hypothetical protein VTH82DRAFT_2406 [Thermothelomyces myriococcoides]
MVHPTKVTASQQPTARNSRPGLSRARRSRASGSFHAGEPFPFPQSYDETRPSGSRARRRPAPGPRGRLLRRQSTPKYHTFPTSPPESPSGGQWSPGRPRSWYKRLLSRYGKKSAAQDEEGGIARASDDAPDVEETGRGRQTKQSHTAGYGYLSPGEDATPLPWAQLSLLALLSLAEQTALNSIGPYLPTMVASFDEIPEGDEGLYVGLLASSFALAQLTTNLLWGYLSDRVGRKPTMLLGTSLLMVCFIFFGLCRTFAQLIMVHVAMGLFNGNAAIVPTCLGEITDRTNQSSAFTWLPVIYSLGSITGPALGGLLVGVLGGSMYPFLAPNIVVAALLLSSVVVLAVWFDETLNGLDQRAAAPALEWLYKARDWCAAHLGRTSKAPSRLSSAERLPSASNDNSELDELSTDNSEEESDSAEEQSGLLQRRGTEAEDGDDKEPGQESSAFRELSNRNTLAVLGTYLVFQLTNISYNSLYPIFAASPPPTGRELGPGIIGVSLSLAGVATIAFQVLVFPRVKSRIGNLGTYRYSLLGMAISMALMPWIDYVDSKPRFGLGTGKLWLYSELGAILVLKNICAVGGLSSVMLLITNSAPSNETLGTLNGIAQTLSAAGRSVGPFLSGGLFTLSTRVRPKGEALAWGLFAGVALVGWLGSLVIRNKGLESADWEDDEDDSSDEIDGSGDEEQQSY